MTATALPAIDDCPVTQGLFGLPDVARLITTGWRVAGVSGFDCDDHQTWGTAVASIIDRLDVDLELHHADPRWMRDTDPAEVNPGDVPAVRFLHGATLALTAKYFGDFAADAGYRQRRVFGALAEFNLATLALIEYAVPYWVSGADAVAVLGSTPPEPWMLESLRLPYPAVCLVFGSPLRVDTGSWWFREYDSTAPAVLEAASSLSRLYYESIEHIDADKDRDLGAAFLRDGSVHGLILTADSDGVLADEVVWLISGRASDGETLVGTKSGSRRQSVMAPIIDNAACAVAWGSWNSPDTAKAFTGTSNQARKMARTGSFKRRAGRGEDFGVRTLDLRRTAGQGREAATGRTLSAHLRRGHWRRVRVGPRHDWHYEGRWIAPTLVSGTGDALADAHLRTYRLPDPPEYVLDDLTDFDLTDPD
jgi:hypothetical protein